MLLSSKLETTLNQLGVTRAASFLVTHHLVPSPFKYAESIDGKREIWREIRETTRFRVESDDVLLDVGSGRSELDVPIAESVRLVIGLDINVPHLIIAKDCVVGELKVENIVLFHGGLCTGRYPPPICFHDSCFDAIVCHIGLGKDEVFVVLSEIARILKPGGQWLFAYPQVWLTGQWSPNEAEQRLLRYAHEQHPGWQQRRELELLEAASAAGFDLQGEKRILQRSVARPLGTTLDMFGLDSLELFATREIERRKLWAEYGLTDTNLPVACFVFQKRESPLE